MAMGGEVSRGRVVGRRLRQSVGQCCCHNLRSGILGSSVRYSSELRR